MTSALRPTVRLFGVKALTNLASLVKPAPPFRGAPLPPPPLLPISRNVQPPYERVMDRQMEICEAREEVSLGAGLMEDG